MMFKYPLDSEMILARKRSLKKELLQKEGLTEKRVAILSGTTIGEVKNILELFLLDSGIKPVFFEGGYGRYYEELLFDDPSLREFAPDILYLHTGIHNIDNLPFAGEDKKTVEDRLSAEWKKIESVLISVMRYGCPVITNNFEYPSVRVMGNREAYDPAGKVRFITELNLRLSDYARDNDSVFIHDINYLSAWYGLERWADPSYYHSYKYGLAPDAIPLLCLSVSSIIKALFGKNKKALMLDLDNTLWGGVIGDDGVEGIRLGVESPEGMAYSDLQNYARELRRIGVLLGVLSKNEEQAARDGFSHPASTLSPDDFSIFYADWDNKPDNLRKAAESLNLGTDYFVFLDDNPAERELMDKAGLGVEVAAYTLPERVAEQLSMSGYFEVVSLSEDDRKRADMYRENQIRKTVEGQFSDYKEYLKSLGMRVYFSSFTSERQQRITQLANKTNQFNMTSKRYTQEEIAAVEEDKSRIKIAARLVDKFGDNGIVSELVARIEGDKAIIELFLMSCRVFNRDLEFAMIDELVRQGKEKGVRTIEGIYRKTKKNVVVEDLYPLLGFDMLLNQGEETRYQLDLSTYHTKNHDIEVIHE